MNYGYSDEMNFGLGDLGFSLKKTLKKAVKSVGKVVGKVVKIAAPIAKSALSAVPVIGKPLGSVVAGVAGVAATTLSGKSLDPKAPAAESQIVVTEVAPAPSGAAAMTTSAMAPVAAPSVISPDMMAMLKQYGPWIAGGFAALLILPRLMGGGQPVIIRSNPRRRR